MYLNPMPAKLSLNFIYFLNITLIIIYRRATKFIKEIHKKNRFNLNVLASFFNLCCVTIINLLFTIKN